MPTHSVARTKRFVPVLIFVSLFLISLPTTGLADQATARTQPLWEFGIGIASVSMPNYRGSKSRTTKTLPLPYLIYRGDFLQLDRQGIRGVFYDKERISLDLSADGSLPSSSNDDSLRSGMPDLDAAGEIGPSLNLALANTPALQLTLRLPLRAVVVSDFKSINHIGWKAHPQLRINASEGLAGWNLGITFGPLFANRRYHEYYYGVAPQYVTDWRPSYQASGGYSGSALMLTTSRRFGQLWVGGFLRYDNLSGATFADSPLVETRHSLMAGIGAAWVFGKSSRQVPVDHLPPLY